MGKIRCSMLLCGNTYCKLRQNWKKECNFGKTYQWKVLNWGVWVPFLNSSRLRAARSNQYEGGRGSLCARARDRPYIPCAAYHFSSLFGRCMQGAVLRGSRHVVEHYVTQGVETLISRDGMNCCSETALSFIDIFLRYSNTNNYLYFSCLYSRTFFSFECKSIWKVRRLFCSFILVASYSQISKM